MIPNNLKPGALLRCINNSCGAGLILGRVYKLGRYKNYGYVVLMDPDGHIDNRGWMFERFEVAVNPDGSDYQDADDIDLQPMEAQS